MTGARSAAVSAHHRRSSPPSILLTFEARTSQTGAYIKALPCHAGDWLLCRTRQRARRRTPGTAARNSWSLGFPQVLGVRHTRIRAAGCCLLMVNAVKRDTKEEGTLCGSELRLPTRRRSMGGSRREIKATSNMIRDPRVAHKRTPGSKRQRWRRSILRTRRAKCSWRHLARSVLPSCNQLSHVR